GRRPAMNSDPDGSASPTCGTHVESRRRWRRVEPGECRSAVVSLFSSEISRTIGIADRNHSFECQPHGLIGQSPHTGIMSGTAKIAFTATCAHCADGAPDFQYFVKTKPAVSSAEMTFLAANTAAKAALVVRRNPQTFQINRERRFRFGTAFAI